MKTIALSLGIARPIGKAKQIKAGAAGHGGPNAVSGKIDPELKNKIFERDNYTCRACGFHSKKYQEIHHVNSNLDDYRPGNLATTCIFCHQCYNLDRVPVMRSGVMVWLPEISQARLHHIARAIYVARISQGDMAEAARKSLDILMGRREEVKKRLGTDDPYTLSMILRDYLSEKHYYYRAQKLEGIRLFPLDRRIIKEAELEFNQFPQILAYWRSKDGPFGGKAPAQWVGLYKSLMASG
ncbi:MAG: HNH endonuclease [Alphaproteobacteria bacterium]|nr:HNH endonuclease [Alphaproteobacteria bacterium]MCD8571647.1 HNH endonuclease [Alphaproteobacteria bacterium]